MNASKARICPWVCPMRRSPKRCGPSPERGRVGPSSPVVSDAVIDRGNAWLWMPTFCGIELGRQAGATFAGWIHKDRPERADQGRQPPVLCHDRPQETERERSEHEADSEQHAEQGDAVRIAWRTNIASTTGA